MDQTVLLNKSDYISHIQSTLNSGLYTVLKKDSSSDHVKKVKRNVKIFFILSDQTKYMIIPFIDGCAIFYALLKILKIHKPTLAFHLIVSNVRTDSFKLVFCPSAICRSLDL